MMDGGKAVKVGSDTDGVETDILYLIQTGSLAAVNELHDSGEWTDLEKAVDSEKDGDGKTWHYTAMTVAALYKQLEVMRWLIVKGANVDETREWHELPSNTAAGAGFIEGLELLKERAAIFQRQTAMAAHLPNVLRLAATCPPSAFSAATSVLWTAQTIQAVP